MLYYVKIVNMLAAKSVIHFIGGNCLSQGQHFRQRGILIDVHDTTHRHALLGVGTGVLVGQVW